MRAATDRKLELGRGLAVPVAAIASAVALAACGSSNTASSTVSTATAAGSSAQAQSSPSAKSNAGDSSGAKPTATTGSPAPPSSPAAGPSTSLKLAANPDGELSYNTKQLSAKAGRVTITMTNMSPLEHNVTLAQGLDRAGRDPDVPGRLEVAHAEPEARDVLLLLLCPRPSCRRAWKAR